MELTKNQMIRFDVRRELIGGRAIVEGAGREDRGGRALDGKGEKGGGKEGRCELRRGDDGSLRSSPRTYNSATLILTRDTEHVLSD